MGFSWPVLRMGFLGDEKNPFWYPRNIGVNLGISHRGTLGSGYIQLSPETVVYKETMMTCSSDTNPPIPGWCFFHKHPRLWESRKKKHGTVPGCPTWTSSEECQFLTRNSFLLESHWQGVRIWTWTIVCPVRPCSHLTPVQKLAQGINSLFVFFCCNDSGFPLVDVYNLDEFHPLNFKCGWIPSIFSMTHDYCLGKIQIALMVETSHPQKRILQGKSRILRIYRGILRDD